MPTISMMEPPQGRNVVMDVPVLPEEGILASVGAFSWVIPLATALAGWMSAVFFTGRRIGGFENMVLDLRRDLDDHLRDADARTARYDQRIGELQREHSELKTTLGALPGVIMDRMNDGPLEKIESMIREMRASVDGSIRDIRTRMEQISDREQSRVRQTPRRQDS